MKTIAMNQKFNLTRFGAVLKCELVQNRMGYLFACAIFFVFLLLVQLNRMGAIIVLNKYIDGIEPNIATLAYKCMPIFIASLVLYLIFETAKMCGNPLKTKGCGINYLMMPASNLEKFLSRVLICTLLPFVLCFAGLFLADLVRMLFVFFFDKGFYGFTLPYIWKETCETYSYFYNNAAIVSVVDGGAVYRALEGGWAVFFYVLFSLYVHSLFMLGGCLWRNWASVKIALILVFGIAVFGWAVNKLNIWMYEPKQELLNILVVATMVLGFAALALTVFHWWLSYRLFSRKQVVPTGRFIRFLQRKKN